MTLSIIVAVAGNGVIGRENGLPWRLPGDLRRFKALTMGHTLIMGRKTFASIGRPLPGRRMVVITRGSHEAIDGIEWASSVEDALAIPAAEAFIAGGAQIYAQTLPLADRLYITEVQAAVEGDTTFPTFDRSRFLEIEREEHPADEKNEFPYSFVTLVRRS